MVHVSHLKQVFPADIVIDKIPDYSTFSRKTKLAIHPGPDPRFGMVSCYDPQYPDGREAQLAIFGEKGEESYEHEKGVRTDGQVWSWKPSKHSSNSSNSLKT